MRFESPTLGVCLMVEGSLVRLWYRFRGVDCWLWQAGETARGGVDAVCRGGGALPERWSGYSVFR
jgi:hypothetical protein